MIDDMEYITCKNNYNQIVKVNRDKFFFRPSVYGIIIYENKILLLRNKSNGKLWLPGGGLNIGESNENCLKRETLEETGIDIIVKDFLLFRENFFYYEPLDEAYHAFLFFYICEPKTTILIEDDKVDDLESEKPRWVCFSDLKVDDFADFSFDLYNTIQKIISAD